MTIEEFINSLNIKAPALVLVAGDVEDLAFTPEVAITGRRRMSACQAALAKAKAENRVVVASAQGDFFKVSSMCFATVGIQVTGHQAEVVHNERGSVFKTATLS